METPLHQQKVEILSRLVKDGHLTFPEALLLLKEEPYSYNSRSAISSGLVTVSAPNAPYTLTTTH
jgi:hypothetical protein